MCKTVLVIASCRKGEAGEVGDPGRAEWGAAQLGVDTGDVEGGRAENVR